MTQNKLLTMIHSENGQLVIKQVAPEIPPNGGAYPKFKYHAQHDARAVVNPEQEAALGPGWYDTPTELQAALRAPECSPSSIPCAPEPAQPASSEPDVPRGTFTPCADDPEIVALANEPELVDEPAAETTPEPPEADAPLINATEDAWKLAGQNSVDLSKVTGTGKDGLIRVGDVRAAIEAKKVL